mgnify:CR=1 FL=1
MIYYVRYCLQTGNTTLLDQADSGMSLCVFIIEEIFSHLRNNVTAGILLNICLINQVAARLQRAG